jgi:hypothetical protein
LGDCRLERSLLEEFKLCAATDEILATANQLRPCGRKLGLQAAPFAEFGRQIGGAGADYRQCGAQQNADPYEFVRAASVSEREQRWTIRHHSEAGEQRTHRLLLLRELIAMRGDISGGEVQLSVRCRDPRFCRIDALGRRLTFAAQPAGLIASLCSGALEARFLPFGGGLFGAGSSKLLV